MNSLILKSLFAINFASFAEDIFFTTEIDASKKEYPENTFRCGDSSFNRVSFLYGANGAGKTFFCKILKEIQRLLSLSPVLASPNANQILSTPQFEDLAGPVKPFAFDTSSSSRPTTLGLELVLSDTTYHYEFSIKGNTVVRELLTKKYRRTEKLIERTSPAAEDISLRSEMKGFESIKHIVRPDALCLSMAAMMNNEMAKELYSAICQIDVISMALGKIDTAPSDSAFSDERIAKYVRILRNADPTIRNIRVSSSEEEIARQKVGADDFENREIIMKKLTVNVESTHAVYDGEKESEVQAPIKFFAEESLGTIKLFTLLPPLFDVLETGGVLVIDELENGMHLALAKELVQLFNDPDTNSNNAQLICTSHQPLLLDGNFRRDQVWVAVKDTCGKSQLCRLSNRKTAHAKVNLTTQILRGAFGCNPQLFFDNHT